MWAPGIGLLGHKGVRWETRRKCEENNAWESRKQILYCMSSRVRELQARILSARQQCQKGKDTHQEGVSQSSFPMLPSLKQSIILYFLISALLNLWSEMNSQWYLLNHKSHKSRHFASSHTSAMTLFRYTMLPLLPWPHLLSTSCLPASPQQGRVTLGLKAVFLICWQRAAASCFGKLVPSQYSQVGGGR